MPIGCSGPWGSLGFLGLAHFLVLVVGCEVAVEAVAACGAVAAEART